MSHSVYLSKYGAQDELLYHKVWPTWQKRFSKGDWKSNLDAITQLNLVINELRSCIEAVTGNKYWPQKHSLWDARRKKWINPKALILLVWIGEIQKRQPHERQLTGRQWWGTFRGGRFAKVGSMGRGWRCAKAPDTWMGSRGPDRLYRHCSTESICLYGDIHGRSAWRGVEGKTVWPLAAQF